MAAASSANDEVNIFVVDVIVVKAYRQAHKCSRRAHGYFTVKGDKAPPVVRDSK